MTDRKFFLDGPAGRLEARLRGETIASPPAAALLLHPHPLHGGTLHNKTLFRLAKSLVEQAGVPNLRFNFRGVGGSEGSYDAGRGEADDATAALDWLKRKWPAAPRIGVGYSFGAALGLAAIATDGSLGAFVALGLPCELNLDFSWLRRSTTAGYFVQGARDEFGDCERLRAFLRSLGRADDVACIEGADHLFTGREDAAVAAVVHYIGRTFGPSPAGS